MAFAAAIVAGGAIAGGVISAKTGSKQIKAQQSAERRAIEEQRRQFDIAQELTAPRREAETAALGQLQNILGIGEQPFDPSGIQIPGQQFAIDEASQAILRQSSALGGIQSGNTLAALQQRALGITNQNFLSNFLQPLTQLATGQAGQQAGQQALQLGVNVGNLQPQGGINRAKVIGQTGGAINTAVQGGLSNFLLLNALQGGGGATTFGGGAAGTAAAGQAGQNILFGGGI